MLYEDGPSRSLSAANLRRAVEPWLPEGFRVEARGEILSKHGGPARESLARELARIRVRHAEKRLFDHAPFPPEVAFERRILDRKGPASGIPYDGWELQRLYRALLPPRERRQDRVHVVLTHRLPVTLEGGRYHARVCVLGRPAILSTRGIVEGPAKPREFYLRKQQAELLGGGPEELLLQDYQGRFVLDDDPRFPELFRGYVLAALRYQLTGEAWCPEKGCMLYNAHWQEELLAAQLGGHVCEAHAAELAEAARPDRPRRAARTPGRRGAN